MDTSGPRKDTDGDDLFTASLKGTGPRMVQKGERIVLYDNQPKDSEDPGFHDLVKPSSNGADPAAGLLPLHNYYSEFRLGHGDPLLKASMGSWPNTTTDFADPVSPHNPKSTRAGSCSTLMDASLLPSHLPFVDVVPFEDLHPGLDGTCKERGDETA